MRRYVTRPQAWWDDGAYIPTATAGERHAQTVMEAEPRVRPTGVLDASGTMIYAREEMDPVGFVRLK